MAGWMDGWMGVKSVLRISYNNQQLQKDFNLLLNSVLSLGNEKQIDDKKT